MGRHSLATKRRKSPAVLAAVAAPAAVFFAAGGDSQPSPGAKKADPVVENVAKAEATVQDVADCCMEIVAAPPVPLSLAASVGQPEPATAQRVAASRWRVVQMPKALPAGVAPERGLQVRTILVARSISMVFPEILNIGGVRPDPLPWHPHGLAIDVMIPNSGTAAGIALGNQIVAYVLKNAERFGMQDAIWRGRYYTPGGSRAGGYGHYDHVHITTTGGGYPTGGEIYYR